MAVLDLLGGQTVTVGKSSSVMEWVVMVVDTGDSCHSLYELVIMLMAMAKQATTIATQMALAVLDLAVEMYTRPWIVEPSKKSRNIADNIFTPKYASLDFQQTASLASLTLRIFSLDTN